MKPAAKKEWNISDLKKQLSRRTPKKRPTTTKGRPYTDHLVAFIDLLGYREKISQISNSDASKEIYKLETVFSNVFDNTGDPKSDRPQKINFFSDCVCISQELPTTSNEEYLDEIWSFLVDLIHIQGELLFKDIVVRGGVTIDKHYSSERIIFSKGLLKAYDIESNHAVNPCILADSSIADKLSQSHRKLKNTYINKQHAESKLNSLLSLLVEQENGECFLNYLSFWSEVDTPEYILPFFLKHKEIIEKGAAKNKYKQSVSDKYRWMTRYHNFYLKKAYKIIEDPSQPMLLIDEEKTFGELSIPRFSLETDAPTASTSKPSSSTHSRKRKKSRNISN